MKVFVEVESGKAEAGDQSEGTLRLHASIKQDSSEDSSEA